MDTIETKLYYGILICCLLTGAFFVFINYQLIRRQRKFYREQRLNMLETSAVIEDERRRIAHDLHDDLSPQFALIFMQVSQLKSMNEEEEKLKQKALTYLRDAMEKLTLIAANLTPRRFKDKGLQRSLEDFVRDYTALTSIRLSLIYEIDTPLPPDAALQLYRIVQELVHNAVKHSGADELSIHLKEKGLNVYLDYRDNGKGFRDLTGHQRQPINTQPVPPYTGMGWQSMQNRINLLGGSLVNQQGKGTSIFIELPKNFSG